MRKITHFLIFTLCILFFQVNYAQLYVSPNSYVYVNDQYLTVTQNVNLQNDGNIYLRRDGQLLQKTTLPSSNQGQGKLSLFQEGTTNNFQYNYWCSPVGNSSAAIGNESFGISMLNRPADATNSSAVTVLPTTSYDGTASPFAISSRWIYKYLSGSTYSNWVAVAGASTIAAGEGFTMKGTSGTDATVPISGIGANNSTSNQRYDFRGKPNDGNILITVGAGNRTLTGNPYPSAIDLKAFLLAATNSTGIAYFWEHDKTSSSHLLANYRGGYGMYSPMGGVMHPTNPGTYGNMGVYTPAVFYAYDAAGNQLPMTGTGANYERRFCPIGQGFLIEGAVSGTVTMSNNFRVYMKEGAANFSQFERTSSNSRTSQGGFLPEIPSVSGFDYTTVSTDEVPQIRFNTLLNNQGIRQVVLAFDQTATDGVDFAMDAKAPGDAIPVDMYFFLNNEQYSIQAINFNENKRVRVGFKSNANVSFKITVADIINFNEAENVYLFDNETGLYHDIKNATYEFVLPTGTFNNRYEITFRNGLLSTPSITSSDFSISQNNSLEQLVINNPKLVDLKSVMLFDMGGKLIFNKSKLGANDTYSFSTTGLSDAIYIVKLITSDNQEISKKVSIYRSK